MSTTRDGGVVSVREIFNNRRASLDEYGNRTYTRCWRVTCNHPDVGPLEATSSGALPAIHTRYEGYTAEGALNEFDDGASLRRYEVEQQDEAYVYLVFGHYSSEKTQRALEYNPASFSGGGFGGGGFDTGDPAELNPLLRGKSIRIGTLRFQKYPPRDLDGKPFVASNGQRFDPPLAYDRSYITIAIARNESITTFPGIPKFSGATIKNAKDKVNSVSWVITTPLLSDPLQFDAGTVKCESIEAETHVEQGFHFWRVQYLFHFNPYLKKAVPGGQMVNEGWQPEVMDVGTYEKIFLGITNGWTTKPIVDKTSGMPVTNPVPLDATGKQLVPTNTTNPPTFDYKYVNFRTYETFDFNLLALP